MIRPLLALLGKELRQQALVIVGLALCGLLGLAVFLLGTAGATRSLSVLQAHVSFLIFLPLAGLILGNRLVVAEYYGRTQLFVEALPVRRWQMVAVKFALGLTLLGLGCALSLGSSALVASYREPVGPRFLAILSARTASYVFCLWSFLFLMGLVGRFRIPIYILCALILALLEGMTEIDLGRFGPFAVIHPDTLPFEREAFPLEAIGWSCALGAGFLAASGVLALIREGSLAEVLAQRMSQREKALIGMLLVGFLVAVSILHERRRKEPLVFLEEEVLVAEEVPLEVLYLQEERRADAEALVARLGPELRDLQDALGWEALPPVRVAYHASLDGRTFQPAELEDNEGVLVRANFRQGDEWDADAFAAFLLQRVLGAASAGRAGFEPRAWVLDGFSRWWGERDGAPPPADSQPLLRALWATRAGGPTPAEARAWLRTREALGEPVAEGLAYSGLRCLESLRGREAVLALARRLFREPAPRDLRILWAESFPRAFEAATGMAWLEFCGAWASELARLREEPALRARLAELPAGEGLLELEHDVGAVRHLRYAWRFQRPPAAGNACVLLHCELPPFDWPLEPPELLRVEHLWADGEGEAPELEGRLLGRYGPGARVFLALEVEAPALGCPLRLRAERWDIR